MGVRDRIEIAFERWGRIACRSPWRIIALMALFAFLPCALGLPLLERDVAIESYLREGDPIRRVYDEFRDQFGNDENVLLLIQNQDIFSLGFLEKLRALHHDLEQGIPSVDEVRSLINARVTGDELIVEELLESWPQNATELEATRERALHEPSYRDLLLSKDGRTTTLTIRFIPGVYPAAAGEADTVEEEFAPDIRAEGAAEVAVAPPAMMEGEELSDVVESLYQIIERHQAPDFHIHVCGGPPMTYQILQLMTRDMTVFTTVSNVLIGVLLCSLFRRFTGVFLPWLVVNLPLIATFGAMGWLGLPITMTSQILPSFLLVVCVGDAVHLLSVFYQRFDGGMDKQDAICFALGHSGLAVLMTSVTTAGALFSFFAADLAPLRGLGIAAPIGILFALVYAVVLLPALVAVCPVRRRRVEVEKAGTLDRILVGLGDFSTGRPWLVVCAWSVAVAVSLYGASQLHFSHAPHKWFSRDDPLRIGVTVANQELGGAFSLEVTVDTGRENGLYEPDVLNRMERMQSTAEAMTDGAARVGKVVSVLDVVKETNRALNGNDPSHYQIPQDRALIAQELLLFENAGTNELADVVDSRFRKARMSLLVPYENSLHYMRFVSKLESAFEEIMQDRAVVEFTGVVVLYGRTLAGMLSGTAKSYAMALLVIAPLMVLLIGNLRMGLLSLIPNVAPIIVGMGLMYWMDYTLDLFTVMIGSIAIGVAVDDTIHFMHNYRRYYEQCGSVPLAVRETLGSTGRALLITSTALAGGFFAFSLASMKNVQAFGLITGCTIVVALLADLMLSPALVTLAEKRRSHAPGVKEESSS
jgi:predicted RND superfamily exporter protein